MPYILVCLLLIARLSIAGSESSEADQWLGRDREETFNNMVAQLQQFEIPSLRGMNRISTTWEKELDKSKKRFLRRKRRSMPITQFYL